MCASLAGLIIGVLKTALRLGKFLWLRAFTGSSWARGRFGGRLFRRGRNAETHEEETKAFAEGVDEAHGVTFPETLPEYRVGHESAKARPALSLSVVRHLEILLII